MKSITCINLMTNHTLKTILSPHVTYYAYMEWTKG